MVFATYTCTLWFMFQTSLSYCIRVVLSNTYYFGSSWSLLHVYVLVHVLDIVIVLFQSGVFKYILVCSGWGGAAGLLCISAKRIYVVYVRRGNCFGGIKTKVRGTVGNFNVPPRGFCQVWLNAHLSPRARINEELAKSNFDFF